MWRSYLTVGYRALVRNKAYAAINLLGLSVGLTAYLLILLYVRYETSYDAWLPDSDRIFQVQRIGVDPESPDRQVAQGGATVPDIVQLLAWQFSKPVIIANLLAWPVAWRLMRDWLNSFDARIDLGPGPFLVAGLLALAIAVGTVAGHAVSVARLNPVHALRYE